MEGKSLVATKRGISKDVWKNQKKRMLEERHGLCLSVTIEVTAVQEPGMRGTRMGFTPVS